MVAALAVGCVALTAAAAQPPTDGAVSAGLRSAGAEQSPAPWDPFGGGVLAGPLDGGADGSSRDRRGRDGQDAADDQGGVLAESRRPGLDTGLGLSGATGLSVPGGPDPSDALDGGSGAAFVPASLGVGGIPAGALRAYRSAAAVLGREQPGCGIDFALLAGIGRVESDHGRFAGARVGEDGVSVPAVLGPRLDGSLAGTMVVRDSDGGALDGDDGYDRAVGPMQFLPGTWARWGSDGDGDGRRDPQDIDDAALAAARYLCQGGGDLGTTGGAGAAVRRYNNSSEYVALVLATAESFRTGRSTTDLAEDPSGVFAAGEAGWTRPRSGSGRPGARAGSRAEFRPAVGADGWSSRPGGVRPGSPASSGPPATTPVPSTGAPSAGAPSAGGPPSASPVPSGSPVPPSGGPTAPPSTTPTAPPPSTPTVAPPGPSSGGPTPPPSTGPAGPPVLEPPVPSGTPTPCAPLPTGEPSGGPGTAPSTAPGTAPSTAPPSTAPATPPSTAPGATPGDLPPCPPPCGEPASPSPAPTPTVAPSEGTTPPPSCAPGAPAAPGPTQTPAPAP